LPAAAATGDPQLMRQLNRSLVLNLIREGVPISRARIAKITHLARPTVSNIVAGLIEAGLVLEVGSGVSAGGRRPTLLQLNADAHYAVGINLGVTNLDTVVVNLKGAVLARASQPTEPEKGQEQVIARARELVAEAMNGFDRSRMAGLGVAATGLVDHISGINLFAPNLGWHQVPLRSIFAESFNLPVYVENNARAMALAESWFGVARGVSDFAYIHVGTGLGAGIFLHGELYRGEGGGAGEIGHTTVNPDGLLCRCGNRGCLETLVTGPSLVRRAREAIAAGRPTILSRYQTLSGEMVSEAARARDEVAGELLRQAGFYLGIGIANLVQTLNLRLIVLGGGVIEAGEILLEAVREAVQARTMALPSEEVRIVLSQLGPYGGAIGACVLVLERLFSAPRLGI
jgi:N-acetylglucosamine repressor